MKIHLPHPVRSTQQGMATMVFIVLLAVMMTLIMAESRALYHLHRETKFLEQQQIKRLNAAPAKAAMTTSETK